MPEVRPHPWMPVALQLHLHAVQKQPCMQTAACTLPTAVLQHSQPTHCEKMQQAQPMSAMVIRPQDPLRYLRQDYECQCIWFNAVNKKPQVGQQRRL